MQTRQFWTKVLKVALFFTITGGVITSIWLAVSSGGAMWWIAPLGIVITFFAASAVGTLVEISENIAMQIDDEYQDDREYSSVQTESNPSEVAQTKKGVADPKPIKAVGEKKDCWLCPDCGAANDFRVTACRKCGWQA